MTNIEKSSLKKFTWQFVEYHTLSVSLIASLEQVHCHRRSPPHQERGVQAVTGPARAQEPQSVLSLNAVIKLPINRIRQVAYHWDTPAEQPARAVGAAQLSSARSVQQCRGSIDGYQLDTLFSVWNALQDFESWFNLGNLKQDDMVAQLHAVLKPFLLRRYVKHSFCVLSSEC